MDVEGVEGDTAVDWTRVKVYVSRQEQENSYSYGKLEKPDSGIRNGGGNMELGGS